MTNLDTGESTEVAIGLERASPVDSQLNPVWASNGLVGIAHDITGAYLFPIEGAGLATSSPAATPVATPETGTPKTDAMEGGPIQSFDLAAGRAVSMSPDGHYVAGVDPSGESLCTYVTSTMKQAGCVDLSGLNAGIRTEDIVWSPDSTRLAFAEDVFRYASDGDLWVMDAETGALTDLTDDGYTGNIMIGAPDGLTYFADVAPAWTPDSQFVTFSRTTFLGGDSQGNTIAQVSASGGEVETLTTVTDDEPGVFYFRGGWSPDGTRFFYNVAHADTDDPDNGIWVYDTATGESTPLASAESVDLGPLSFREISSDGSRILAWYPLALGQFGSAGESFLRFVDPQTGAVSALPDPTPDPDDSAGSWIATFSPDGAYLLQAAGVDNDALDFWVTDLASGASTEVASDLEQAVPVEYQLGPVWGSNGVVFVSHSIVGVYLFPIEGAGLDSGTAVPVEASPVASPAVDTATFAVGSDAMTNGITPIFAGPGAESPVVYLLPPNHTVHILADPVTDDEGVWYPIFDPGTQIIGYVQANRLEGTR